MSEFDYIRDTIEQDGFIQTFTESEFENIEDPEFHTLRESFLAAYEALAEKLGITE